MTVTLVCRPPYQPWTCSCCGRTIENAAPSSTLAGLACDPCLDLGRKGEPFIPLTVRPLKPCRRKDDRPIVAVLMREGRAVIETGELFPADELPARIRERPAGEPGRAGRSRSKLPDRLPPAIVTTDNPLDLLTFLDQSVAGDSEFWQWQVSVRALSPWRPEARSRTAREYLSAAPVRFGYASRRGDRRRAEGRAIWWLIVPLFVDDDSTPPDLVTLLRFGVELRDWSNRVGLPVAASVSAYGSRLLKDARFAGDRWRRKVPAATNRRIRSLLPGNHYQLMVARGHALPTVHKWDQAGAHHYAAFMSRFPHPDRLQADGWFRRPAPFSGRLADRRGPIRAGTPEWVDLLSRAGMFVLTVRVPATVAGDRLRIPGLRRRGATWQTLSSVEIAHARMIPGVQLGDIWCCWTSPDDDDLLRELALWAGGQLDNASPTVREWLKPTLLSAYGMLAARARRFRNGWRWCGKPDGAIGWQTRYGMLAGYEKSTRRDREPQTVNVLWRAIIETRVRLESLEFARKLAVHGLRPVAVYADAVFATGELRTIKAPAGFQAMPPWRYEGIIHDLTFESRARYRSREETRLPGVPKRGRKLVSPLPAKQKEVKRNGSTQNSRDQLAAIDEQVERINANL